MSRTSKSVGNGSDVLGVDVIDILRGHVANQREPIFSSVNALLWMYFGKVANFLICNDLQNLNN